MNYLFLLQHFFPFLAFIQISSHHHLWLLLHLEHFPLDNLFTFLIQLLWRFDIAGGSNVGLFDHKLLSPLESLSLSFFTGLASLFDLHGTPLFNLGWRWLSHGGGGRSSDGRWYFLLLPDLRSWGGRDFTGHWLELCSGRFSCLFSLLGFVKELADKCFLFLLSFLALTEKDNTCIQVCHADTFFLWSC